MFTFYIFHRLFQEQKDCNTFVLQPNHAYLTAHQASLLDYVKWWLFLEFD